MFIELTQLAQQTRAELMCTTAIASVLPRTAAAQLAHNGTDSATLGQTSYSCIMLTRTDAVRTSRDWSFVVDVDNVRSISIVGDIAAADGVH